jgi:hypothetical protein
MGHRRLWGLLPLPLSPLVSFLPLVLLSQLCSAETNTGVMTRVPRITFEWSFPSSDGMLVYAPWDSWTPNITNTLDLDTPLAAGLDRNYPQITRMGTSTPGANVTLSYWGTDIYIFGAWAEGTAYDLVFDGQVFDNPVVEQGIGQLAYTGGAPAYGFHTASLVLRSGSFSIRYVNARHYAFVRDV